MHERTFHAPCRTQRNRRFVLLLLVCIIFLVLIDATEITEENPVEESDGTKQVIYTRNHKYDVFDIDESGMQESTMIVTEVGDTHDNSDLSTVVEIENGAGKTADIKQANRNTKSQQVDTIPSENVQRDRRKSPTLVLLLTYFRSGSTLTADIIQQVPGVFYAYEPLKPYLQAYRGGYFSLNGICSTLSLLCRPMTIAEQHTTYLTDVLRYYSCDLAYFTYPFLWSYKSRSVTRYKECTHILTPDVCLKQCFNSARLLKTIPLSMDIVEVLMNKLPNLKVVHLLRDPRGMIQSRKRGGFVKPHMNLTTVARSVCQRFERDIEIATKLRRKYPGRLKTYLYEQIAEQPQLSSSSLFKFLGFTAPENFDMWLHNHTAAGTTGKYFGTTRANSTLTASSWRRHMNYTEVVTIDNECTKYYKYAGILKAQSKQSLNDLNIDLRVFSSLFGDFI